MQRHLARLSLAAVAGGFFFTSATAQDAPTFMQETYPQHALEEAVQDFAALEGEGAVLDPKTRQLIALGAAAGIPCEYCTYYHTEAARAHGASEQEIREAIAHAAQVRKWSTVLNGMLYDEQAFRDEVDEMFATN